MEESVSASKERWTPTAAAHPGARGPMISLPSGTNIWIAAGHRPAARLHRAECGAQTLLERELTPGMVFVFFGRCGDLVARRIVNLGSASCPQERTRRSRIACVSTRRSVQLLAMALCCPPSGLTSLSGYRPTELADVEGQQTASTLKSWGGQPTQLPTHLALTSTDSALWSAPCRRPRGWHRTTEIPAFCQMSYLAGVGRSRDLCRSACNPAESAEE